MIGLVLTAMVGSIDVVPTSGKDDHKRVEKHDNGRYQAEDMGMTTTESVILIILMAGKGGGYAPPPVIYAPAPGPGMGVLLSPINIR